MQIYQQSGWWIVRKEGERSKFATEAEANAFAGLETIDGSEEKKESSTKKKKKTDKSVSKKDTTNKSKKV
jgi:hypothetical protein